MEGIAPSERIAASFQYPRLDVATQQFSTFQAFSGLFRSLHSGLVAQAAYFPGDVTCRAAGKNHHENEADTMNFVNGRQHASSHLEDRGADSIKRIDRRNRLCGRRWIASMCLPGLLMALTSVPVEAQVLRLWGDDTSGQISGAPDGEFKAIAGGALHSLALRFDGTPVLWGVGPFGPPPIPAALATERFNSIAIGRNDAVLIQLDGSLAAFGRTSAIVDVPSGFYKAVSVSAAYAVAIGDDGRLKAWGLDSHSTVSGPTTGLLNAPKGGVFKEVDSIVLYSLALHEDGTIYGWGSEGSNGTNVLDGWTPTPEDPRIFYLPGESYKAISAGNVHALAIRPDGSVTGWGNGSGGALDPPTHVRFKAIDAGWGYSIGLSTDGILWGWGTPTKSPFAAQAWTFASLGWQRHGNTDQYYVPDERFKSISAGAFHIMAITAGRSPVR